MGSWSMCLGFISIIELRDHTIWSSPNIGYNDRAFRNVISSECVVLRGLVRDTCMVHGEYSHFVRITVRLDVTNQLA